MATWLWLVSFDGPRGWAKRQDVVSVDEAIAYFSGEIVHAACVMAARHGGTGASRGLRIPPSDTRHERGDRARRDVWAGFHRSWFRQAREARLKRSACRLERGDPARSQIGSGLFLPGLRLPEEGAIGRGDGRRRDGRQARPHVRPRDCSTGPIAGARKETSIVQSPTRPRQSGSTQESAVPTRCEALTQRTRTITRKRRRMPTRPFAFRRNRRTDIWYEHSPCTAQTTSTVRLMIAMKRFASIRNGSRRTSSAVHSCS